MEIYYLDYNLKEKKKPIIVSGGWGRFVKSSCNVPIIVDLIANVLYLEALHVIKLNKWREN